MLIQFKPPKRSLAEIYGLTIPLKVELVKKIGLEETIVLMQLDNLIQTSNENSYYYKGRHWTCQSIRKMTKTAFPFWSKSKVARIINRLEQRGFILKDNFNEISSDKTTWYSIDYHKIMEEIK